MLWVWLLRVWDEWRAAVVIVKPETVLAWHRRGFRLFWTWKSRCHVNRPSVPRDVRRFDSHNGGRQPVVGRATHSRRTLETGNRRESGDRREVHAPAPTAALPNVAHVSHESCRPDHRRRFLRGTHTATYRLLFVLVIVAHQRRRVVHVAVTAHPTAAWTAQQLREAFPGDEVPRYLIRDRDHAFAAVGPTATGMGIHEVLTAPRSPWQNAYAERVIGSIRRECLDHVIVVNEIGLSRILTQYFAYYHQSRTHLSLAKDAPQPRLVAPPTLGPVVAIPQVGGLHHRYARRAP